MNIEDIKLGTKLQLQIKDSKYSNDDLIYLSQLEEIFNKENILIVVPIFEGIVIPISLATQITIMFYNEKGVYSFEGEISQRIWRGKIALMKIRIKSEIKKKQRREFFRFNWIMPIYYKKISESEKLPLAYRDKRDKTYIKAVTKNISGGGVRIISAKPLKENDIIKIQMDLDNEELFIKGQVNRCEVYEKDISRYDIGVEYKDINHYKREIIIKFIFCKQVEVMQKGTR